ncbi:longicornsin [Rhipicephalus microplus]|uniref:Putative conserved secreted protein n=1 Tax=Rhipicephalus microplus TaxID=6941 RepID=A0A6G5A8J3_RHIMP
MLSMEPRVLLCLFLFVAGSLASEAEKAHSRSRRGLACVMGNPLMCRRNCFMLYPGSTGVCMGFRCRCIGGPFGPGFLPFIRPIIPFGPLMGPMLMG